MGREVWKSSPDDQMVDAMSMSRYPANWTILSQKHTSVNSQYVKDFYIRGDYAGDRTAGAGDQTTGDFEDLKCVREI